MMNAVHLLVYKHMFTTGVADKGLGRLIKKDDGGVFALFALREADITAQGRGDAGVREIEEFEKLVRQEIARNPPFGLSDLKIERHILMENFKLFTGADV